jgi:hypothetical protein
MRADDQISDFLVPPEQRGLLVNQILETQKELEEQGGTKKLDVGYFLLFYEYLQPPGTIELYCHISFEFEGTRRWNRSVYSS